MRTIFVYLGLGKRYDAARARLPEVSDNAAFAKVAIAMVVFVAGTLICLASLISGGATTGLIGLLMMGQGPIVLMSYLSQPPPDAGPRPKGSYSNAPGAVDPVTPRLPMLTCHLCGDASALSLWRGCMDRCPKCMEPRRSQPPPPPRPDAQNSARPGGHHCWPFY